MKISFLLFAISVCALPAAADPVNYAITFTGGPFENGAQVSFAPNAGSFTYDSATGFSDFLVYYNGDVFDFTAAANTPTICSSAASCSPGTPAQELEALETYSDWIDEENSSFTFGVSGTNTLTLGDYHGQISAQAAGFSNFTATSPPAVGALLVTVVPEPSVFAMLSIGVMFLALGKGRSMSAIKC